MIKNKKNIIILSILLVITIIVIIICVINYRKSTYVPPEEQDYDPYDDYVAPYAGILKQVNSESDFYTIETCIKKFYSFYEMLFTEEDSDLQEISDNDIKEYLISMLDNTYIEYNSITVDNILEKLPKISESELYIDKMLYIQNTRNVYTYFVYGQLRDIITNEITDFSAIINLDTNYSTFSILLNDYLVDNNLIEVNIEDHVDYTPPQEIVEDNINVYSYVSVKESDYVNRLFNSLKSDMIYYPERAYNNLSEELKNTTYSSYDTFKKYVNSNMKEIVISELKSYTKEMIDGQYEFSVTDSYGNIYKITIISPGIYKYSF